MSSRHRLTLAAACSVLCVLPAAAAAASGPNWILGTGEGGGFLNVSGSTIKSGATAPSTFKCNKLNVVIPKSIKVKRRAFSYTGKLKGQSGTVTFKGTFSGKTKVKGSTTVTKGSCKSTLKWSGKPVGSTSSDPMTLG